MIARLLKAMFGSIPCYPGYNNIPAYSNSYFYCTLCDGVVSPTNVDIAIVVPNKPTAHSESKLSVLRCKNHPVKGLHSGGPITSLRGLIPFSSTLLEETHQKMLNLCARVHCLDVLTVCGTLIASLLAITGAILQFIVAAPISTFIPLILFGVAIAFYLGTFLCTRISQKDTLRWQALSKNIIRSSHNVPVQAGTERYTLLTEFPPTCYENHSIDLYSIRPSSWCTPRVVVKKTACKLSARIQKILKNQRGH